MRTPPRTPRACEGGGAGNATCAELAMARLRAHRGITLSRTLIFSRPTTLIYPGPWRRGGMALVAEHLVGRADEIGSLERLLDELDRGRPGSIEVVGEPGIGKTRLLRELAARAEARGHIVLSGSASELERDLPFSVFVDALDEYVAGLEPRRLGVLDDQVQAELASVCPEGGSPVGRRRPTNWLPSAR